MTGDTHILRKLGKDITMQELYHMRDDLEMSVAEIAKQLGCSRQILYKYFGKKITPTQKKAPAETKVWAAAHSLTQLIGGTHEFIVDVYRGTCVMKAMPPEAPLTRAEIHSLINQLTYIEQLLQRAGK